MNKGSSGSAPAPDPKMAEAALRQAQVGEDWLAFSKESFKVSTARQAELDKITKQVAQIGLDAGKRYKEKFVPLEDEFVETAKNYDTPERQAAAAAEAQADVQAAAAGAKATARRETAAIGISPDSGRYAGIERSGELGTTLATADAANRARAGVRDKGLALKADAINLGRGLPSQAAGAVSVTAGSNEAFNRSLGIMDTGYRGAIAGNAGMGQGLAQQHSSQLNTWQAQQKADADNASGVGSFLGGALGLILSDEDAKTDKEPVAEGAALEAVEKMPVEKWRYNPGIDGGEPHVGPYAQDFKKATGAGDGKTIAVQDAIGVTMKAVQDLGAKVSRIEKAVGIAAAKPAKGDMRRAA